MAIKNCSMCHKEVGFLGRFELKDGYICDDCYNEVRMKYSLQDFDNLNTTVEDVQNGIFANPKKFVKEKIDEATGEAVETAAEGEEVVENVGEESGEPAKDEGCVSQLTSGCGCVLSIAAVAAVIAIAWFVISGGFSNFMDSLFNKAGEEIEKSIEQQEQQFIDMVKNTKISGTDTTYGDFAAEFDSQEWNFFISEEGYRVVEFIGDQGQDTVRIQYVVSDYGENRYLIEPAHMDINGVDVDDILAAFYLMM